MDSSVFSVRLPAVTRLHLEEMAAENHHSAADETRKLIDEAYEKRQAEKQNPCEETK